MARAHSSTPAQRAQWVSELIAQAGTYGVVTRLSRATGVSRQSLYSWTLIGLLALVQAFTLAPASPVVGADLRRAILTLFVAGHASYRGIQQCLLGLGYGGVSVGTIAGVMAEAQERALVWFASPPASATPRVLALDELYGKQRRAAYLSIVDTASYAVWAAAGPVAVDSESWTLLLWEVQEHGLRWEQTISDGGRAMAEACATVDPAGAHRRDVWHLLHQWGQVQGRLDRRVEQLRAQTPTVARQAARVAAGQRPRGRQPLSDEAVQAARGAAAERVADGLRYLGDELRRLSEVVVVEARGVLSSAQRQQEMDALLALLAELATTAEPVAQRELPRLHTHLRHALPRALGFAVALDGPQEQAASALGAAGVALLGWAWQRRALLGPTPTDLLAQLPPAWSAAAGPLLTAWEQTVRASSAVENWHSLLRPHLAVHRTLSPGLLALLAVWHNHRVFARGVHAGHSPLQLSGVPDAPTDWLVALGYPPARPGADVTPMPLAAAQLAQAA